jgi:hypothetical protein
MALPYPYYPSSSFHQDSREPWVDEIYATGNRWNERLPMDLPVVNAGPYLFKGFNPANPVDPLPGQAGTYNEAKRFSNRYGQPLGLATFDPGLGHRKYWLPPEHQSAEQLEGWRCYKNGVGDNESSHKRPRNNFDEAFEHRDWFLLPAQHDRTQHEYLRNESGPQNGLHITSSTPFRGMANDLENSLLNSGYNQESDEKVSAVDLINIKHSDSVQLPTSDSTAAVSTSSTGLDKQTPETIDRELEFDSNTVSLLPNIPALAYDRPSEPSPANTDLQSPLRQTNLGFRAEGQPTSPTHLSTMIQPPAHSSDTQRKESKGLLEVPSLNPTSSIDMSRSTQPYQYPISQTLPPFSTENKTWDSGQDQQGQRTPTTPAEPKNTAHHNSTNPSQSSLPQQRSLTQDFTWNGQIALPLSEQSPKPAAQIEIENETQHHLKILTRYFTHVLKHRFQNVSPARAQAIEHWIQSAKWWESGVPGAWKRKLHKPYSYMPPVQELLFRQIRIHILLVTWRRCRHSGLQSPSPSCSEEWTDDVKTVAFSEQIKLMKLWTALFEAMLQDLRIKFPLFEDTYEEFQRIGGWRHLLSADGVADVYGL